MASLGAIAGGIAMSPLRAAGGLAKGTAKLPFRALGKAGKLAGAGIAATAMAAMDVSGTMPIFTAAAGLVKGTKKGITAGYAAGKKLLRPVGEGTVAEDSALAAIAEAASETSKTTPATRSLDTLFVQFGMPLGPIGINILIKISAKIHPN